MKKRLSSFLFLLVLTAGFSTIGAPDVDAPKKPLLGLRLSSVELQWEDSPGAFQYEVQIYNSKGKLLKTFFSKSSLFKFKSTSGKIKIRGRVIDAYNNKGLWTSLIEIEVPPEDLQFAKTDEDNTPISVQASPKTAKGRVNLSWPESIQAKRYNVKVYDQDNKVVAEREVTNLNEKFDLDVGSYKFSVTPIGIDRIKGKEVMAPRQITVGTAQTPQEKFLVQRRGKSIQIKMPQKQNFEILGALEYANHLSEVWTPVKEYIPFKDDIWTPDTKFRPGRYRIAFWVTRKGWLPSDKFYHEFVIKPTEAEIIASALQ